MHIIIERKRVKGEKIELTHQSRHFLQVRLTYCLFSHSGIVYHSQIEKNNNI